MKILITGGSGFLGVTLARYLIKRKAQVVLYDQTPLNLPSLSKKVSFVAGDIRNKKTFSKAVKGCDYVIHAAAALPIQKSSELIYSVNVDGTRNVLEQSFKNNVKRVVFISTTAVYKINQPHPIYEEGMIEPIGSYGGSKIDAEKVCHEFQKKGLTVQIIRPKTFLGPSRLGVFEILFEWIDEGRKVPILGNGRNYYQLLDVTELCNAIWLSLFTKYTNETFNIGAKHFGTVAGDLNYVIKKAHSKAKLFFVPALPVQIILSILEKLNLSPLAAWHYKTANIDSYVSADKAEKLLKWRSKKSGKEVLFESYEWFLQHKKEFEGKTGLTHRVGWNQKILGIVKKFM